MPVDQVFMGVGQTPGLEIWRIEKLKVVPVDQNQYGEFYSGDSYIVLSTVKPPKSSALKWDLHFWLGKETSQDEAGVAAYKTVELDDSLGGGPVQHREVQDHESSLFLSYFKKGIRYLEGGIESGFRKVERGKYEKRLLHVKGKRNVRVTQVELHVNSLNDGDVFVLDDGEKIFVWTGNESSIKERMKGMEVARQIRDEERGGKAQVIVVEPKQSTYHAGFFRALGSEGPIKSAAEGGDDSEFESNLSRDIRLYRVSDASGELEINLVGEKVIKQEMLDTYDCFILEAGRAGLFVWVGKGCTDYEKKSAWSRALGFLEEKGYPNWTKVTRVVEEGETPLFKQCFTGWRDKNVVNGFGSAQKSNIAKVKREKFNATKMHTVSVEEKQRLPDDGTGRLQIWRVENFNLVAVPEEMYGIFFGGDSYVVLYTYTRSGKEENIIYFWQGLKSSTDETASSAMLASNMNDKYFDGNSQMVRVVQNKENEHFLLMFHGEMVVYMGGTASGFRNRQEVERVRSDDKESMLFQVRGTTPSNTRAAEVPCKSSSLNSNDVFILSIARAKLNLVWYGLGSSAEERETAIKVCHCISPASEMAIVQEKEEPAEFWQYLGGKGEYASGSSTTDSSNPFSVMPRLFQCSNASGNIDVEEIVDFQQDDLCSDDVMILDSYDEVYVWIGTGANAEEKKEALTIAMQYIKTDPSGRTVDTTNIFQIKQGHEPINFTCHFLAWDEEKWKNEKSYEDMLEELEADNAKVTLVSEELAKYDQTYPLDVLKQKFVPDTIDPTSKEMYLSDEDFQSVFQMSKDDFGKLKEWKKVQLKKQKGLF
ncbi:advillin-like [Tubulanus polymorphus]|uniref:advillin-like n=1 Tax=Tubulanus polymorphus TaxID=672921 RepID=UPI003DA2CCF0